MEGGYSLKPVTLQGTADPSISAQFDRFAIISPPKVSLSSSTGDGIASSKGSRCVKSAAAKITATVSDSTSMIESNLKSNVSVNVTKNSTLPQKSPPQDGGLIKAVMSHACALTGRDDWT